MKKNIKFIAIFGGFGFSLSLLCGLISGARVGRLFLTALICLVAFAAMAAVISILFDKFMAVDSTGDFSSGSSSSSPENKGQTVDIVIEDEDLPVEANTNRYSVGTNHQMLNDEDYDGGGVAANTSNIKKSEPTAEFSSIEGLDDDIKVQVPKTESVAPAPSVQSAPSGSVSSAVEKPAAPASSSAPAASKAPANASEPSGEKPEFVPVSNLETLYNGSKKETAETSEQSSASSSSLPEEAPPSKPAEEESEIDALPSMDNISFLSNENEKKVDEEDVDNDDDFGSATGTYARGPELNIQDSELMAKAISTVLTGES